MTDNCWWCKVPLEFFPKEGCHEREHWEPYTKGLLKEIDVLQEKLDMKDDDRDKYEIIDAINKYPKVRKLDCHECKRHYEIPMHLVYFECVCGHRCKLRRMGAEPIEEELLDIAMAYFGNERLAALAWITEIIASNNSEHYSAEDIRKMARQEMNRWELVTDHGYQYWKRKDKK